MTLIALLMMTLAGPQAVDQRAGGFKAQLAALSVQVEAQQQELDAYARWLATPIQPVRAAESARLDPVDQEALRKALERGARCLTGKLVKDPDSSFWVPEMKPGCLK